VCESSSPPAVVPPHQNTAPGAGAPALNPVASFLGSRFKSGCAAHPVASVFSNRLMACSRVIHVDEDLVVEIVVRCGEGRLASEVLELVAGPCATLVGRTLARLPEAVPRADSGDSAALEVVTTVPPLGEDEAPMPRSLSDHELTTNWTRARAAGVAAAEKISGRTAVVPETPPHPQNAKNRYYVVLVGRPEVEHARGVYPRWNSGHRGEVGARAAVCDPVSGTVCAAAVFHGFPTVGEIDAYCAGAGEERPRRQA